MENKLKLVQVSKDHEFCGVMLTQKGNVYYINDYRTLKIYSIYHDDLIELIKKSEDGKINLAIAICDYIHLYRQ